MQPNYIKLPKSQITQALVQEYLDYDPVTGILTWKKKNSKKTVIGSRAGTDVKGRCRIIQLFGNVIVEHRVIWLHYYGYMPKSHEHIDHINHNEYDNRIQNLRLVSQKENNRNLSLRKDNALGITGIYEIKTRQGKVSYVAEIKSNNKRYCKQSMDINKLILWRKQMETQLGFHTNHGIAKP